MAIGDRRRRGILFQARRGQVPRLTGRSNADGTVRRAARRLRRRARGRPDSARGAHSGGAYQPQRGGPAFVRGRRMPGRRLRPAPGGILLAGRAGRLRNRDFAVDGSADREPCAQTRRSFRPRRTGRYRSGGFASALRLRLTFETKALVRQRSTRCEDDKNRCSGTEALRPDKPPRTRAAPYQLPYRRVRLMRSGRALRLAYRATLPAAALKPLGPAPQSRLQSRGPTSDRRARPLPRPVGWLPDAPRGSPCPSSPAPKPLPSCRFYRGAGPRSARNP